VTVLLQELVSVQAEERGDALALVMGEERVTYAELERTANRLAGLLVETGCRRGDRVAILAPKSPTAVVAMLATLKSGGAYVPVDTSSPVARIAHVIESVEPVAVLASHATEGLVDELRGTGALTRGVAVGALDVAPSGSTMQAAFDSHDVDAQSSEPLPKVGDPDDAAHILFTSGSTGVPKGVVITHANVTAFLLWATRYFGTRPGDRISGHPPLHFDLSTFDVYGTLSTGAELHLVPPATFLPLQLAEFIARGRLTQWFSVPSTFTYMARRGGVPEDGFPTLERVIWCGEVLPTPVLAHWMRRVPNARFTNLYGPTEATIASSSFTVPGVPVDETEPIPIGTAIPGEELLVLDEKRHPVRDGEIGELYIAGPGLSPGYWRDEEQTRRAFVADPRPGREHMRIYRTGDLARVGGDGLLRFLGRTDSQIKSRGYRIELGEIEAALSGVPGLTEFAVVGAASDGFEGTTICCAYVPTGDVEVDAATLRAALEPKLPAYMLPTRWLTLDALPKNVNGKIDRPELHVLFEDAVGARVP
jgi:amino acid adenylation domain-containing protein